MGNIVVSSAIDQLLRSSTASAALSSIGGLAKSGGKVDVDAKISFDTGAAIADATGQNAITPNNRRLKSVDGYDNFDWQQQTPLALKGLRMINAAGDDSTPITFQNGTILRPGTVDAGRGGLKGLALVCALSYELKWDAGWLYVLEQNGSTIRAVVYTGSSVPTINDDSTKGFVNGSLWTLDNETTYICVDNTAAAAVWRQVVDTCVGGNVFALSDGQEYNITLSDSGKIFTDGACTTNSSWLQLPEITSAINAGFVCYVRACREWNNDNNFIAVYYTNYNTSVHFKIGSTHLGSLYSTGVGDTLKLYPTTISGTNYWVAEAVGYWQDRD